MKAQNKKEETAAVDDTLTSSSSKIDAIKEIIFGENIQKYNTEFDAIKADILAKKEELQNLIGTVESELLQNIDTLSTDINIRITDLEHSLNDKIDALDESKVNRKLLGDLFVKLGNKISE